MYIYIFVLYLPMVNGDSDAVDICCTIYNSTSDIWWIRCWRWFQNFLSWIWKYCSWLPGDDNVSSSSSSWVQIVFLIANIVMLEKAYDQIKITVTTIFFTDVKKYILLLNNINIRRLQLITNEIIFQFIAFLLWKKVYFLLSYYWFRPIALNSLSCYIIFAIETSFIFQ